MTSDRIQRTRRDLERIRDAKWGLTKHRRGSAILGINYLILDLIFGTLPFERAMHTLGRFAGEMM